MAQLRNIGLVLLLLAAGSAHAYDIEAVEVRAERGDVDAQYQVATDYANGIVVERNLKLARKWFRRAARNGHVNARATLGHMYREGIGVPQDYVAAHMWFNLAAASSDSPVYRDSRDALEDKMDPGQVAEAQRIAREWMQTHGN